MGSKMGPNYACLFVGVMRGFFMERGYPSSPLREDLRKISTINRMDTINNHGVLNMIKKTLLGNFRILNNDLKTGPIFTDAPSQHIAETAASETCWCILM